ncbi:MAG TPA: glycosyltransferase [Thermoflexales bacterium]|nr:glycosyltransferase [Thermoflexales bacterium]
MRVSLLSKALVVGAYQRKCELIAQHGAALTALVPERWDTQPLEAAHTAGYDLRALPIRLNGNFHLHHYPTLPAELRRAAPQVFHVDEEPYNLATFLAIREGLRRGAKIVFFSWQNINRAYPPPFRWFEQYAFRRAHAAIAGSEDCKRVLQAKGCGLPIHVLPQFGVDEAIFAPSAKTEKTGAFVVGFAGRLVKEKGVDVLLRACAGVAGARVRIAGAGAERASLAALAQALDMSERVEWVEATSTQMPAFYAGLDALVVPSRTMPNWKEQFGRVIIEAMACGVPVIGSSSGEIPNVIGDAGLIFREDDVAGLQAQLQTLMASPALRESLGLAGRKRMMDNFTMRRVAQKSVEIYRSLAASR